MTTKPELQTEGSFVAGLAAIALFVVLGAVFMGVSFPAPTGFGEGASITKSLGAAMFDIEPGLLVGDAAVPAEGFLVAFILIAVALDAALDGALMLAKRDDEEEGVVADGGTHHGGDDS
ncbi:proton-conducting membrane transporter [Haloarcula sp. Atlit-7R]|uniref:proton-conducting membrane transporter n=1 Tax=Haloarcula sp. Atlit-7R TaxID=2282125 RepID=UPI000EF14F8C|nr:proton-conducting membrane transporter [Haloarcula sp. Atlit-7R]RLM90566.1 proton-conducting membrane transporter [Haloarcula sp. Atlit-7R]